MHTDRLQRGPIPGLIELLTLLVVILSACQTRAPLPPVDFAQPGWTVREGQAIWERQLGAPEIAGEILVATRPEGRAFVQFSKNGLPLLISQSTGRQWSVDLPIENKHYSGRGAPPKRLMLLYLPRALAGEELPRGWTWNLDDHGWRLENNGTGESLEGYFSK